MLLAAASLVLGANPSSTWGGSGWKQSPSSQTWYVALPDPQTYWGCARTCSTQYSNASLPCVKTEADAEFIVGLTRDKTYVWTGLYQSLSATKATEGWDAWASASCPAKTGLDAPWVTYSPTFSEPNWWQGQREACAMGQKKNGEGAVSGVLLDAPCNVYINCVCEGALAADAFTAQLALPPEKPGMDARTQVIVSVVTRTAMFFAVFGFLCSFFCCLKLPACMWRQFLDDEQRAPSRAALSKPRSCCGDIVDHEKTRALHKDAPRVDSRPFDCIRGFGALQVAVGHFFTWWSPDTFPGIECGGGNAVLMFFIMSGFVMQIGYAGKGPADGSCCCCAPDGGRGGGGGCCTGCGGKFARTFWARRVARLLPLTWVSILIFLPIFYFERQNEMGKLPGLLQGLYMVESAAIESVNMGTWIGVFVNGPLWTLCAQFFFYAIFPTLVDRFHTRHDPSKLCGIVAMHWGIYAGTWFLLAGFNPTTGYMAAHINPGNKFPLFLMGMALASQALTNAADTARFRQGEAYWGSVATAITLFLAVYTAAQIFAVSLTGMPLAGFYSRILGELVFPPLYALWLYALSQSPTGLAARTFNWRPFRILGNLSFALYVLHFPLIHYYVWVRKAIDGGKPYWLSFFDPWETKVRAIVAPGSGSGGLQPWDVAPCFAIIIAVSALAYHTIEKPMRSQLQAMLSPRRAVAPNSSHFELEAALPMSTAVPVGIGTTAGGEAALPVATASPIKASLITPESGTSSAPEV